MRQWRSLPLGEGGQQEIVRGLADHGHDLHVHRREHRLAADERVGLVGAPPRELGAALASVSTLPFAQRGRHVAELVGAVEAPERELPADLRLERHLRQSPVHGRDMQRTASSTGEPGAVEEDACVLVQERRLRPVLLLSDALLPSDLAALSLVVGQRAGDSRGRPRSDTSWAKSSPVMCCPRLARRRARCSR